MINYLFKVYFKIFFVVTFLDTEFLFLVRPLNCPTVKKKLAIFHRLEINLPFKYATWLRVHIAGGAPGHRRGPLRVGVGPRLPQGLHAAGRPAAAPLPGHARHAADGDGDAARPQGHHRADGPLLQGQRRRGGRERAGRGRCRELWRPIGQQVGGTQLQVDIQGQAYMACFFLLEVLWHLFESKRPFEYKIR